MNRRGFAIIEAASIAEALRALHQHPRWMLLDLMLPDGCGIDILHHVQSHHLDVRTVIVTGCCADLLDQASHAGAEHCFTKPLDVERLINVINA